jgi:hypothetical protein
VFGLPMAPARLYGMGTALHSTTQGATALFQRCKGPSGYKARWTASFRLHVAVDTGSRAQRKGNQPSCWGKPQLANVLHCHMCPHTLATPCLAPLSCRAVLCCASGCDGSLCTYVRQADPVAAWDRPCWHCYSGRGCCVTAAVSACTNDNLLSCPCLHWDLSVTSCLGFCCRQTVTNTVGPHNPVTEPAYIWYMDHVNMNGWIWCAVPAAERK